MKRWVLIPIVTFMLAGLAYAQELKSPNIIQPVLSEQEISEIRKKIGNLPPIAEKPGELKVSEEERPGEPELTSEEEIPEILPQDEELHETVPSEIENYMGGKISPGIARNIRQYGYDLFRGPPSTFAPVTNIPVGPDYVIGPGDGIKIVVWGKIDGQWSTIVDRDGNISFPTVGTIGVAGLSFRELKELLHKEYSKYFKDFNMNISMGVLRNIRIYIVGNAMRPGAYTISSLSTLVNALFESGGPSKTGSMRSIQLKRNGKTVVQFDMYDFLLNGDKSKDVRLMPEDVIFIPPIGKIAGIAGHIRTPAIYELKGDTKLSELIRMAGGVTATGYLRRVQIERIYGNEAKKIIDKEIQELTPEDDIALNDGDIVKIFPISDAVVNAVSLKGNVARPGKYQWYEGMTVRDILGDPEKDLLPETFYEYALLERRSPRDYHKDIISFNLEEVLLEKKSVDLQPYDEITIYSKWDFRERPKVRIFGAVNKPGEYELFRGISISNLIKIAGGLKPYALKKEAELTRVEITDEGPVIKRIIVNLEKAIAHDPANDLSVNKYDYLFVRTVPDWQLYRSATISGEVTYPGTYTVRKGERISSLLERAGGLTNDAYVKGAVFTRESVRALQQRQLNEAVDRLEHQLLIQVATVTETALSAESAEQERMAAEQRRALLAKLRSAKAKGRLALDFELVENIEKFKKTPNDIVLEEGDSLSIPERPAHVQVIGAVYNQNAFVYDRKSRIDSYLSRAGGLMKNANRKEMYVLKVDGTAISERGTAGFQRKKLDPGDTIVVPEKIDKIAWLRNIKDLTQILYQIAVTAAVIVVL